MSTWNVDFSEQAKQDFSTLDITVSTQVAQRIDWLVKNFDAIKPIPLHNEFSGLYKLRTGNWRVAYKFYPKELIIKIHSIDHRSKIYKRRK